MDPFKLIQEDWTFLALMALVEGKKLTTVWGNIGSMSICPKHITQQDNLRDQRGLHFVSIRESVWH